MAIPVYWAEATRRHDPKHEVWVGVSTDGTEVAERVDVILDELRSRGHELRGPTTSATDLLARVHDAALLDFLERAHREWTAGPYDELVGQTRVVPYLFPTPAMTAGVPVRRPKAIHADAGSYAYDTMTLVGPGTWAAATAAADCAASAAGCVLAGGGSAYALSRPPGHHATPAGFGGSCYLNNAAVAAEALRLGGIERVGIVDIDAHHGNGTAAIFYERGDVLYGSVHVDPGAGWFPHVQGYADETGRGEGAGMNRNLPLPERTGDGPWLRAIQQLAEWVRAEGCDGMVVSLGVDAAADDPESPLLVTQQGYREAGGLLNGLGLPAVIVQEGGYHLPTLGTLVGAYLEGHGRHG